MGERTGCMNDPNAPLKCIFKDILRTHMLVRWIHNSKQSTNDFTF